MQKTEHSDSGAERSMPDAENPDAQFAIDDTPAAEPAGYGEKWSGDEQILEAAARPEHVIDPIFWCMRRKGIAF